MSLLKSIFGGRIKSRSPEVERIYKKLADFMEDENQQNNTYPLPARDLIINGCDVDELPYAGGEFGRSVNNPIPVNGLIGELIYLSLLKTSDGGRLLFHRLGALDNIDVYEAVSINGSLWDILYLSPYHPRKSRKSPLGYAIAKASEQPLLYGVNYRIKDFPHGLQQAIRDTTKIMLGFPMRPPEVRKAVEGRKFVRPDEHQKKVQSILTDVSSFSEDIKIWQE